MPVTTNKHFREYVDLSDVPADEIEDWNEECTMWIKYKGIFFALCDLGYNADSYWNSTYGISNTGAFVFRCEEDGYYAGIAT